MTIFSFWWFYFILYVAFISVYFQVAKRAFRDSVNDGAAMIVVQLAATLILLFFIPFFEIELPSDWRVYGLLLIAVFFYGISDRLQATGRKYLSVSLFTLIFQSINLFLFIYGTVLYKEDVSLEKLLGLALVIIGNIILFYHKGKFKINKYVVISFLSAFFMASALAIDIGNSRNFNLPTYIICLFLGPAILIKLFGRISWSTVWREFNTKNRNFLVIAGLSWAMASLSYFVATRLGNITTIAPLDGGTVLLNILLAFLIYKQEETRKLNRFVAALFIVSGVIFILM